MELRKLIIFGVGSYTGTALAAIALEQSILVHGIGRRSPEKYLLDNPNFSFSLSDADLISTIEKYKADAMVYLAAPGANVSVENAVDAVKVSQTLFIQSISAALNSGTKSILYSGSFWQFESNGGYPRVRNLYSALKNSTDQIALFFAKQAAVVNLVLFDSYGAGDPRSKILNKVDIAARKGCALDLTEGKQYIYPAYISDVANAFLVAASLTTEVGFYRYWVPGPQKISLKEFVNLYCSIAKIEPILNWGTEFRSDTLLEPYVGECLPGWTASFDLWAGLEKVAEFNAK